MSLLLSILSIFTWTVVGLAVVMIVVNLLLARRRSWIMAIVRVGITVVSAVVALLVTKPLADLLADATYDLLLPTLGKLFKGIELDKVLADLPSGEEGLKIIAASLVAPFLFLAVFLLLRALLSIVGAIVAACVPALKAKTKQGISMALGGLNGFLIVVVVLVPLCGFMALGGHLLTTVADTAEACNSPAVDEIIAELDVERTEFADTGSALEENPVVLVVHSTLGRPIFNYLTTGVTDAEKTHGRSIKLDLEAELGGLVKTVIYTVDAVDSMTKTDFTEEDKAKLYTMEESLLESEWRTVLMTDLLTAAATSWRKGEAYMGMERPALNTSMDPTVNCLLDILVHETELTLEKDFRDILDVVGDFLLCDLLAETVDPQAMIKTISERGLLNTTLDKLNANPRLAPIAVELKALSVRLLTDMLGLDELKNGEHAELMNNVAGELNNVLHMSAEERHDAVAEALGTAFDEYGFEIPADVANSMADKAIDELGADGEITGDELTDYLVNHVDDAAGLIPDELPDDIPDELPDDIPLG